MGINHCIRHSQSSGKVYQAARMHLLQQCQALGRKATPSGQRGWYWQHSHGRQVPLLWVTAGSCRFVSGFSKSRVLPKLSAVLRPAATEGSAMEPHSAKGQPSPALQNSPPWDAQELLILLVQLPNTLSLLCCEQARAALGTHDLGIQTL